MIAIGFTAPPSICGLAVVMMSQRKSMRPPSRSVRCRADAAVGHVGDVGVQHVVHKYAAEMGRGARAGRAVLHLGLVGLGVGDELLEVASPGNPCGR